MWGMDTPSTPERRIAEWVERDSVLGREARLEQMQLMLAQAEADAVQLRERIAQMANSLAEVTAERDHWRRLYVPPPTSSSPLVKRAAKKGLRVAGQLIRRAEQS